MKIKNLSKPFAGAVNYYNSYRPPLPPEVAEYLWRLTKKHTSAKHLLDVGTGTGQVMTAFAPYFEQMIGVDPDEEMLDAASTNLKPFLAERKLFRLFHTRIEDFSPPVGWQASVVTFSRSFHWVEQDATLVRLAEMTEPHGLVALMSDRSFEFCEADWCKATMALVKKFLGEPDRKWVKVNHHYRREWGDVLKASPFNIVERESFPVHREWNYESILGYLYSTSTAAKRHFGSKAEEFETELKSLLGRLSNEDQFFENDYWDVFIGRKP